MGEKIIVKKIFENSIFNCITVVKKNYTDDSNSISDFENLKGYPKLDRIYQNNKPGELEQFFIIIFNFISNEKYQMKFIEILLKSIKEFNLNIIKELDLIKENIRRKPFSILEYQNAVNFINKCNKYYYILQNSSMKAKKIDLSRLNHYISQLLSFEKSDLNYEYNVFKELVYQINKEIDHFLIQISMDKMLELKSKQLEGKKIKKKKKYGILNFLFKNETEKQSNNILFQKVSSNLIIPFALYENQNKIYFFFCGLNEYQGIILRNEENHIKKIKLVSNYIIEFNANEIIILGKKEFIEKIININEEQIELTNFIFNFKKNIKDMETNSNNKKWLLPSISNKRIIFESEYTFVYFFKYSSIN